MLITSQVATAPRTDSIQEAIQKLLHLPLVAIS